MGDKMKIRATKVTRVGEKGNEYRVLLGNLKVSDYLEDLGVDGKIILNWP
jgi:hypothetical protein